ncbi:hypothetical protein F443_13464 [Phytophthora nicotianae P1569]|uniref:Uncharacterized protein n=3 Tax=Phytophthora nicotianae TaxID=4792 RepID=V9ETA4_PHYNI|nr:hypothetical protein F443_13464 [Phytophthora nicotianae P1569]
MAPLKIHIARPKEADKSTVRSLMSSSNTRIAWAAESAVDIRILELDKGNENVELWDEACWPAVLKETDGVILV